MESNSDISFIRDEHSRLILKSTLYPKHAIEISKETNIPLHMVYRRLDILKNAGFLKISGHIKHGISVTTYHNKTRKYHASNPRIVLLLDIIQNNPGICYRDIQKLSGYPHGTLTNSLSNLEKDSKIIAIRSARRANYFPSYVPSEEYATLINLRKETAKQIIMFLVKNERGTFSEIKSVSSKSPSTISLTLTNLVECGIVFRVRGLRPYFKLQDPVILQNALNRIEPNTMDTMKDKFADAFSYF